MPNGKRRKRQLNITMTDRDILEKVKAVTGVGNVRGPYVAKGRSNKPYYSWAVGRWAAVQPLAEAMLPYMGERRSAVLRTLLASPPTHMHMAWDGERVAGPDALKCVNGHAFTEESTWRTPEGHRACRICRRATDRRQRERQKAVA